MALPSNQLSTTAWPAAFRYQIGRWSQPLLDYEMGGVGIQDPSQGLLVKEWTAEAKPDGVYLSAADVPQFLYHAQSNINHIALAFDFNMNPALAWTLVDGSSAIHWYDATTNSFTTTALPAGSITPCATLDDHRQMFASGADIIVAYLNTGKLCYRQLRDRFATERVLTTGLTSPGLIAIGMNAGNRMQFRMRPNKT